MRRCGRAAGTALRPTGGLSKKVERPAGRISLEFLPTLWHPVLQKSAGTEYSFRGGKCSDYSCLDEFGSPATQTPKIFS
jgi:hypothetical protein